MIYIKVVPFYNLKENEVEVTRISADILQKSAFNKDQTTVLFADECGLDKETIQMIADAAQTDLKIIVYNPTLIKGIRNSKKITIDDSMKEIEDNPFELAAAILETKERTKLFEYLCQKKPSLLMPLKQLACNMNGLCKQNQNTVVRCGELLWRVDPEIMFAMVAFHIKPEKVWLKWKYPKKDKEKKS